MGAPTKPAKVATCQCRGSITLPGTLHRNDHCYEPNVDAVDPELLAAHLESEHKVSAVKLVQGTLSRLQLAQWVEFHRRLHDHQHFYTRPHAHIVSH